MTNTEIIINEALANGLYTEEQIENILASGHMIPLHTFKAWKDADNFVCCGCVFTKHDENLKKQGFMIWQDNGTISHKWLTLKECGITPLELLPYPEYK